MVVEVMVLVVQLPQGEEEAVEWVAMELSCGVLPHLLWNSLVGYLSAAA